MTLFKCDRCGNEVKSKKEFFALYKSYITEEVPIDAYFPKYQELCKTCVTEIEHFILKEQK